MGGTTPIPPQYWTALTTNTTTITNSTTPSMSGHPFHHPPILARTPPIEIPLVQILPNITQARVIKKMIALLFTQSYNIYRNCHNHNENTTEHNLDTVFGLDMKMTVQTPPNHPPQKLNGEHQGPQINIY